MLPGSDQVKHLVGHHLRWSFRLHRRRRQQEVRSTRMPSPVAQICVAGLLSIFPLVRHVLPKNLFTLRGTSRKNSVLYRSCMGRH